MRHIVTFFPTTTQTMTIRFDSSTRVIDAISFGDGFVSVDSLTIAIHDFIAWHLSEGELSEFGIALS